MATRVLGDQWYDLRILKVGPLYFARVVGTCGRTTEAVRLSRESAIAAAVKQHDKRSR